jgi:hypothetical protein
MWVIYGYLYNNWNEVRAYYINKTYLNTFLHPRTEHPFSLSVPFSLSPLYGFPKGKEFLYVNEGVIVCFILYCDNQVACCRNSTFRHAQ